MELEITENSYVIQPVVISRAIYNMPTMVRRLIFIAVYSVQVSRPAEMVFTTGLHDLALLFGFNKTKRYKEIKNAIDLASKQVLRFEKEDGGITEWMPWLTYCRLDLKTNTVAAHINPNLYEYVLAIRTNEGFSILFLCDLLKIESRYACKWFEIINSRSGHANEEGHFFVHPYTMDEIKTLFVLDKKKYKTKDFRENVIDKPIKEINDKKLGFHIFAEYTHKNKKLVAVKLLCRFDKRGNGQMPFAYYISRHPKEYLACFNDAKKSLEVRKYKDQKSYDFALTRKALELLKGRPPNEK